MHECTHACIYVCRDFVFMVMFMRAWTHVHCTTHLHSQGSILSHPTPHPTGEGAGHHQVAHHHGVGVGGVGTQDMYIRIMYIHICIYIYMHMSSDVLVSAGPRTMKIQLHLLVSQTMMT